MSCHIPFPIVPKARPRVDKGKAHMPADYMRCKSQVAMLLLAAYGNRRHWPPDACFEVTVDFWVKSSTSGDLDNLLGTILDAGQGIVWKDDRQVVKCTVEKHMVGRLSGQEYPCADVQIRIREGTGFEPLPRRRKVVPKREASCGATGPHQVAEPRKGPSRGSKA